MMLYALSAMVAILLLLYFMPIVVRIDVNTENDDKITFGIRTLYGLLKLKSEIPFLKIVFENGKPALKYKVEVANKKRSRLLSRFTKILNVREGEGVYRLYKKYRRAIQAAMGYMARKTGIIGFNMKLSLGTGDAAATGILYGVTWVVLGNIMALARSFLNMYDPRIRIVPVFSRVQLTIDFSCIINLKLGHIINAGIRAILALLSGIRNKS